jgi:formamidopyrimidine-DNA glycosylase
MPELPEVETTRRGIEPHLRGQKIVELIVRQPRLRWTVSNKIRTELTGQIILALERRAKYLLLITARGTLIIHLGMSGSLRILNSNVMPQAHDHVDIVIPGQKVLRFRDPRRFGALLWHEGDPLTHPLLRHLGPEPLTENFQGEYLYKHSRGRKLAVKAFIMDNRIVSGVGNIYANETLFLARIDPRRAAGRIALARYQRLASSIKQVLTQSINLGGTTLRDFVREDGQPGYFSQKLMIYDKKGKPCPFCGAPIKSTTLRQRASYFCPHCQR